jgi:hypothetical protein
MVANMSFKTGQKVSWKWAGREIEGTVEEMFTSKVSRKIKSATITRNATKENPAYLVKSRAGNLALKLESELTKVAKTSAKATPKMFS